MAVRGRPLYPSVYVADPAAGRTVPAGASADPGAAPVWAAPVPPAPAAYPAPPAVPAPGTVAAAVRPGPVAPAPARPAAAVLGGRAVRWEWSTVRGLRRELADRLAPEFQAYKESRGAEMPGEDAEQLGRSLISDLVARWAADYATARQVSPTPADERSLGQAVFDAQFRLGRIQPYLDDPELENLMINGCDDVWADWAGRPRRRVDPVADSDEELIEFLQLLARRHGQGERSLSKASPMLALALQGGYRLQAMTQVTPRPYVTIRRQRVRDITLEDLVGSGTIDTALLALLRAAMRAGKNIMVTGTQGVGKTTMLLALAREIDPDERIGTFETESELYLHRIGHLRQVVPMEAREGNGERGADGREVGRITISDLIAPSLRMNLRRMIVGEVRSAEIVPMLQAMSGGEGGSLCTIHVRRPDAVFARIAQLCLEHGSSGMTQELAYLMAANALDLVVHIRMVDESAVGGGRHRFVQHVLEVTGIGERGGHPAYNTIFAPRRGEPRAVPTGVLPACLDELEAAGFDPAWLSTAGVWAKPLATVSTVI
ncbi:CpaF family protein [Kitasatospora sp. NPDC057904]|uniref:CpaF family protein n=1 Tax=unclassified Kitasatospora TaxID=2633591 RepID=UPI0036DE77E1